MTKTDLALLPLHSCPRLFNPTSFHNHGFSPVGGWQGPLLPVYTFDCGWLYLHGMLCRCNMRTYRPCCTDKTALFLPYDPWWYMHVLPRYHRQRNDC